MNSKVWLFLLALAIVATQSAACSSGFTTCNENHNCPIGSGDAGQAGEDESVSSNAGAGGRTGSTTKDEGDAGDGGEAGAALEVPALFGPCSMARKVACDGHASAQRLACDGSKWQAGTICSAGKLCNSDDGTCVAAIPECADAEPGQVVCRDDVPLTCGSDLVTAELSDRCDGACKDGKCLAPKCGDGKVQNLEECDDGNTQAGDGCGAECNAEPVALALGDSFSCALASNGVVKCWGSNDHGQLGQGDTRNRGANPGEMGSKLPPVALGEKRYATAISAGGSSVCALLDDQSVKCWGANQAGQLGTGDLSDRGDGPGELGVDLKPIRLGNGRGATSISVSEEHACAVLDNGSLKCWGSNSSGQLGQDSTNAYADPEALSPIRFGAGRTAKAVSASDQGYTCAILDNGLLECWGDNSYDQLCAGLGADAGSGVGDQAGEMSQLAGFVVAASGTVKTIATGQLTACALLSDGSVKCWGKNYVGEGGGGGACASAASLGTYPFLDLGVGRKAKALSLTYVHSCVVLDDGTVKCLGLNDAGQLGTAVNQQAVPLERPALQVATGYHHTCAILDDGTVRCWGSNSSGELGLGDTSTHGGVGGLAGVKLPAVDLSF